MAMTKRLRRKIMKERGIGYISVFILATVISWILGRVTGLDWNFRDFLLDFYVYVLLGCMVFDAVMSLIRKFRNRDAEAEEEPGAEKPGPAKKSSKRKSG